MNPCLVHTRALWAAAYSQTMVLWCGFGPLKSTSLGSCSPSVPGFLLHLQNRELQGCLSGVFQPAPFSASCTVDHKIYTEDLVLILFQEKML